MRSRLVALALIVAGCGSSAPPASTNPATPGPATAPPVTESAGPPPADSIQPYATLAPPPIDLAGAPSTVQVEAGAATAAWIGPAGGTLRATGADGTAYELAIPASAIMDPTPITMTPITAIDELGLSGGLAGAVYLQPAGLALALPATLTISTARSAPPGTRLVGFDVPDAGGAVDLVPASGAGAITVAVFHFSAPGAAFGTTQDLQKLGTAPSGRLAGAVSQLLAFDAPWDGTDQAIALAGFEVLWTQLVEPDLRAVATDAELQRALRDWSTVVFVMNLIAHQGDVAAALAEGSAYGGGGPSFLTAAYLSGLGVIGTKVFQAVEGNKALCIASRDLHALANAWFWAGVGERYAPNDRDWPSAARGCADLAVGVANLPTNLTAGGSDSLGLTFVLKFGDGTQVPADVEATLTGSGFTFASTGGTTMSASIAGTSTLGAGVFASQAPPYTLGVRSCWVLEGLARGLCSANESFPFGAAATATPPPQPSGSTSLPDLSGSYVISGRSSSAQQCGAQFSFKGTATVVQTGASVTVTWTFDALTTPDADSCLQSQWAQVTKGGTFSGTLVGDMTIGFRIKGIPLQCGGPVTGGEVQVGLSPRASIVILNDCGLSVFARADRVSP